MIGNAVTVGASRWLGARLVAPGSVDAELLTAMDAGSRWPDAACGRPRQQRWKVDVSAYPVRKPYQHLLTLLDLDNCEPVSHRAAAGFLSRLERSTLARDNDFMLDLKAHVELSKPATG